MIKFLRYPILAAGLLTMTPSTAGTTDSEGFPVMYLKGENLGAGWNDVNSNYCFNRQGLTYSLTTDLPDGQFKISNDDWSFNYGGSSSGITISGDAQLTLVNNGENLMASGAGRITISFTLSNNWSHDSTTQVTFSKDGSSNPGGGSDPTPQPDPDPSKITVYWDNSQAGWDTPRIHYWGTEATEWPGTEMSQISSTVWSYALPAGTTGIVFTAAYGGPQTDDFSPVAGHIYNTSGDQGLYDGATITPVVTGFSGTLPVLYVNAYKADSDGNFILDGNGNKIIENEIIDMNLSHKNYFKAEYWLDVNGCQWLIDLGAKSVGSAEEPLPTEIKARGNYTRTAFAKKPFKLKLGKKQNLLNINVNGEKSKHWAILAHADDSYGYLRNFVGFNLGERIGLPWTPRQQPIEVVINGNYRGLYFLTESIRVGDGRIDIAELKDNEIDKSLISGGYLIELDNYDEENQIRMDEKSCVGGHLLDVLRVTFNTPESYSATQVRFVSDQFTKMNDLIGANDDNIWSYLDLDDAVRYYLCKEIISDVESFHGSTYMFRDRGEGQKWHFSPLWDCGNAFNGNTNSYLYEGDLYGNTWIPSLRANHKFNDKLVATWRWFMGNEYNGLIDDIDLYVSHIKEAAKADRNRWKNAPYPDSPVVDNSDMQSRRNAVVQHLNDKTSWLTDQWGTPSASYSEPERDDTPAAPLPEFATTAIDIIPVDAMGSATEYFDLTGRRVANPIVGQFYIIKQGENVTKVVY